MKKECPNCNRDFGRRLIKSKSVNVSSNKLGIGYICPFCKSLLVTNIHETEKRYNKILQAILFPSLLPVFVFKEEWTLYLALVGIFASLIFMFFMIKNQRTTLKTWPRWKVISE